MKILAFDVSKKATGVAFIDDNGLDEGSLSVIKFESTKQWREEVVSQIRLWKPTVVIYSDSANKFNGIAVLRAMLGLFFYLETIVYDEGVSLVVTTDPEAKKEFKCGGRDKATKEKKSRQWVKDTYGIIPTEDECDAIVFATYLRNQLTK